MIKAVIADDSAFVRNIVRDLFVEGGIDVVGLAKNGKEAIKLVKETKPNVLVLDIEMPVMNGLDALQQIMDECPLPVFVFSQLTQEGAAETIRALEYGAVDFLLKPSGGIRDLKKARDDLISKVRAIAHKSFLKKGVVEIKPVKAVHRPHASLQLLKPRPIDIVAMGSSTGGVKAGITIMSQLSDCSKPIVWVQHMPPEFTANFAKRLNTFSKLEVKEAENGDILKAGCCYLARGGSQMRVRGRGDQCQIRITKETKEYGGHCPSCDVLFHSVAEHYTANALGIILTGMGCDGTDGLISMHNKGAFVIGQDEASCIVYGMPRAAYVAGAVDVELPLDDIAKGIMKIID
ncbi:MAG: chemotaxis response regulator protein-glutamate methylesterase [Candidatus Omnitrophica bacterium]|nr:chemotaxis response regulator protein-glutamate methylesterase [Candidatus Omnitrophota bacterium]